MATFSTQIQDIVGTFSDETAMDSWLADGAKEVTNAMPKSAMWGLASNTAITPGTPQTINTDKILGVTRSDGAIDQPCREIPFILKGRAADSSEMEYATSSDPVFFKQNKQLDILPSGSSGTISAVSYPTPDASEDSSITGFPDEAEYLVVLYASIKALQRLMSDKTSDLPSDITFSSISVAPASPSFDSGAISISSSAPTYTSPIFTAPAVGTMPSVPIAPILSAQSVTITGTSPTYVPPTISLDFSTVNTYIDTNEDIELAQAKLQEINSQLNEYSNNIQSSLSSFNAENAEYQAKLQKDVQDAKLSDSNESKKLQKYSNEIQSYGAQVNKNIQEWSNEYSSRLNKYNSDLQDALNTFNKENTVFQNELQEKVQEAKNLQTKDATEYSAKLQRYSSELQAYQAEVNKDVQDFNTKLQKHTTDYGWLKDQRDQLKIDYKIGIELIRS